MTFIIFNTDIPYATVVACGGGRRLSLDDMWDDHTHIMVNFEDEIETMEVGDSMDVHDEDDNYNLRRVA